VDYIEDVHELAFIFMDTFHHDIKERIRVKINIAILPNPRAKSFLIILLNGHEFLLEFRISS